MRMLKSLIPLLLLLAPLLLTAQNKRYLISLSVKNQPLKEVFRSIQSQTGLNIAVSDKILSEAKKVSLDIKNMPLEEALERCLKNTDLNYSIVDETIIVKKKPAPNANSAIRPEAGSLLVQGRVMNKEGQPFNGATVTVRGKSLSVITDELGHYSIFAEENDQLIFSFVQYKPQSIRVNGRNTIDVVLELIDRSLDEVTISTGYQRIKQKYLTGSVTSLKMDSIMQPGLSTVDKMLEGRVPGLIYMQNSGQAGAAPKLRLRGTSTYLGSREPLWVVDGIVRTSPIPIPAERINDPDFVNLLGNAISGLNPYDIDQFDVLKDATAAALYGVRAANGVIVITTKRGKPGPPTLNYNVTGTFTRRPRYSDQAIYMMDSRERVDVSREMIEKNLTLRGGALEAYERDILEYYKGNIDYETFRQRVNRAESMNTDWLGITMHDVFATNHTLSFSGGSPSSFYRASVGYRTEPGVIKKESSDLYTGLLNLQMSYRKLKVVFNIQMNQQKRRYTPEEIGLLNYAYGTSRAIPIYNEDGSPYFYSTVGSNLQDGIKELKTMNILNEMNRTGQRVETNEFNASVDLGYEIVKGIQLNSKLAFTSSNGTDEKWFEQNTEWASRLRSGAYDIYSKTFLPDSDVLPFGAELRGEMVKTQNYLINARLNFSRHLDRRKRHQFTADLGIDLSANRSRKLHQINRGYYPDRGHSFAEIDLLKYTSYASWLRSNVPLITEVLQHSLRPFLTTTYIFNDRYVITANTGQEFSNSFGNRSNEKFLPTWALSGRWNIDEDVLSHVNWVNSVALLVSFGTRGNMLPGQTPYTVFRQGAVNTYYNAPGSTIRSFPNPDLAWEKTQDYNGSLRFSILNEKVNGSIGYFYSKTTNAFLEKKVSAVYGAPGNSYIVNGGTLENQGVELDLSFKLIEHTGAGKKTFIWRFDPQLGQVLNKLINTNLSSRNVMVDEATLTYDDFLKGSVPVNGKAVNTFYSYRFKTLDPRYGYPVFYGTEAENKEALIAQYNKMTKEEVFNTVMMESGRREPVLQGGISNTFIYGNWTLNFTFTYSIGNKIRLLQLASGNYGTIRPSSQQNLRKEFTERWRYPGDEKFTNIPAIQGTISPSNFYDMVGWWKNSTAYPMNTAFAGDYYQMYDFSDLRVVKGDYLKLQSASLSYRFSASLCDKLSCKGASLSLSGSNLFTVADKALRGQDPAQSGSAPNINLSIRPVYALNFNISF